MTVMLMPSVSILLVVSSAVVGKDTRAMAGSAEVYYPHLFIPFLSSILITTHHLFVCSFTCN